LIGGSRRAAAVARALIHDLRRLNSGRIGADLLARLPRRERVRAVKAALEFHHDRAGRCC
jgi:hypothetical protein